MKMMTKVLKAEEEAEVEDNLMKIKVGSCQDKIFGEEEEDIQKMDKIINGMAEGEEEVAEDGAFLIEDMDKIEDMEIEDLVIEVEEEAEEISKEDNGEEEEEIENMKKILLKKRKFLKFLLMSLSHQLAWKSPPNKIQFLSLMDKNAGQSCRYMF